ncbi:hypothetical protein RND71_018525 [Anisodus tanguticus]|uniref:Uncharacterized protein n=1 Tax=Anisodus tanguticus TaxID=243964 RepID=A0AAE1S2V3_9SOLA|nr:hypothetical protein RND71_018525 [Anisodus tanguticus]
MATQRNNPNTSKSINEKRQPLSDISNFNLIPTSTLRKLYSSSSASSSKLQNFIRKPPISVSNTSNPNYTQANSDTSVASSNFNSVQNPTGRGNENVVHNQRHTTRKSSLEAPALPFTSSHGNRKDKRKEIDAPFLSLPPTVIKDKGKAIAEPFSSLSPETKEDKGKGVAVLSTPVSGNKTVNNRRQSANRSNFEATALPFTSSHENKKDKMKEIDEPFLSLPSTIMKDKGKAIAEPFSSLFPETKKDKGKGVAILSTPVSGNKKMKGITIHEPFMSASPQKVKAKAQAIPHEKFPLDEKAAEEKFGVLTRSCSSLKKTRGKGMADASVFSCPTLPKTRTNRTEFSGAGNIKPSGSWTDPNGKRKKRRCTEQKPVSEASLPQDFVNYWREHFKEIDEFELPEEEVSYSDLD